MTIVENQTIITGGVDTHLDFHVAAAVEPKGGVLGEKFSPLERVGAYIPGGAAPLVSTALMSVSLAKVAGGSGESSESLLDRSADGDSLTQAGSVVGTPQVCAGISFPLINQ